MLSAQVLNLAQHLLLVTVRLKCVEVRVNEAGRVRVRVAMLPPL